MHRCTRKTQIRSKQRRNNCYNRMKITAQPCAPGMCRASSTGDSVAQTLFTPQSEEQAMRHIEAPTSPKALPLRNQREVHGSLSQPSPPTDPHYRHRYSIQEHSNLHLEASNQSFLKHAPIRHARHLPVTCRRMPGQRTPSFPPPAQFRPCSCAGNPHEDRRGRSAWQQGFTSDCGVLVHRAHP